MCPLPDNDPADQYRYEITVWTGIRRGAGTSSKVSLILYGEDSDSEPRVLEDSSRKPFAVRCIQLFDLKFTSANGSTKRQRNYGSPIFYSAHIKHCPVHEANETSETQF